MSFLEQTTIDTFSPEKVAVFLSENDWVGCWSYLENILSSLSPIWSVVSNLNLQSGLTDAQRQQYVTDFGGMLGELIEALLTDPHSRIPDKNFLSLISYHEAFHSLLYLNGTENTDQLVTDILSSSRYLSEMQQKKVLLLLGMRTHLDIALILKKIDTKYRVPAIASYLCNIKIADKDIYNNKIKLYELAHELEKTSCNHQTLALAHIAYFQCSYLDIPEKHKIKENINIATQRFLQKSQKDFKRIRAKPPAGLSGVNIDSNKPRMAVLMEHFTEGHAMVRVWGPWINALRSEFNVVILVAQNRCDIKQENSSVHLVTYKNMGEMVASFHNYSPDVMVLPSCGMAFYGIIAANMRLAPLQIMGLGHPATSMSPFVDFVYGPPHVYDARAFPKDKFVADNIPMRFLPNMSKENLMTLQRHRHKGETPPSRTLIVSIVGAIQKITAPFLDLLSEIEQESDFDIIFSFHLGSFGIDSLYLQKLLQRKFRSVRFHGWQSYPQYIEAISSSDIVLNSIPFGNTNTVVDTLLLGKPCIGMDGIEPAAKTESYVLDILGMKDLFVAKDKGDYKAKFRYFSAQILSGNNVFFDVEDVFDKLYQEKDDRDFGKSLKWVYDHRKDLLQSHESYFPINDMIHGE